jgi:hypothetical protein
MLSHTVSPSSFLHHYAINFYKNKVKPLQIFTKFINQKMNAYPAWEPVNGDYLSGDLQPTCYENAKCPVFTWLHPIFRISWRIMKMGPGNDK